MVVGSSSKDIIKCLFSASWQHKFEVLLSTNGKVATVLSTWKSQASVIIHQHLLSAAYTTQCINNGPNDIFFSDLYPWKSTLHTPSTVMWMHSSNKVLPPLLTQEIFYIKFYVCTFVNVNYCITLLLHKKTAHNFFKFGCKGSLQAVYHHSILAACFAIVNVCWSEYEHALSPSHNFLLLCCNCKLAFSREAHWNPLNWCYALLDHACHHKLWLNCCTKVILAASG